MCPMVTLLQRYVAIFDHLRPFPGFAGDECAEFFRSASARLAARIGNGLLHFGILQDAVELAVQSGNDGGGCTGRRQDALPVVRFERSEERRVGKECVSTCRSRWSQYN